MGLNTLVKVAGCVASYMAVSAVYHRNEKQAMMEEIYGSNSEAEVLNVGSGQYGVHQFTAIGDVKCDLNPVDDVEFCDIRRLPYRDNQFDYAIASHILEHLDPKDVPRAVSELRRVAREVKILVPHAGAVARYFHVNHRSLVSINKGGVEVESNPWRKIMAPALLLGTALALNK